MADRVQREHSESCEHGQTGCHNVTSPDSPRYHEVCPGGREVTIDYEAAYQWASENFVPQKFVDQCLAAAVGEVLS